MNCKKLPAFLTGCIFYACVLSANAQEASAPRVAGIVSTKSTYWQEMLQGMQDGCEEQGFSFFALDISLQDRDALSLGSQEAWELALMSDVDVIIADGKLPNSQVAEQAHSQGTFLILVDSDPGVELRDVYVGTNNEQAGRLAVQVLNELQEIGTGPVMAQSNPKNPAVEHRYSGICRELQQNWPEVSVKSPHVSWYNERIFKSRLEDFLKNNTNLQAIFGMMEAESKLYAQILKQLNLENEIQLIAFDQSPEILELLSQGAIDAIIVQPTYDIGYQSAKIAGILTEGKPLDEDIVYLDCSVITRENLPLPDNKENNGKDEKNE